MKISFKNILKYWLQGFVIAVFALLTMIFLIFFAISSLQNWVDSLLMLMLFVSLFPLVFGILSCELTKRIWKENIDKKWYVHWLVGVTSLVIFFAYSHLTELFTPISETLNLTINIIVTPIFFGYVSKGLVDFKVLNMKISLHGKTRHFWKKPPESNFEYCEVCALYKFQSSKSRSIV